MTQKRNYIGKPRHFLKVAWHRSCRTRDKAAQRGASYGPVPMSGHQRIPIHAARDLLPSLRTILDHCFYTDLQIFNVENEARLRA